MKKDGSTMWVDQIMLDAIFVFARKDGTNHTFTEVGSPSNWGVLTHEGDKRMCSNFDGCIIPLREFFFSLIGICIPFNDLIWTLLNVCEFPLLLLFLCFLSVVCYFVFLLLHGDSGLFASLLKLPALLPIWISCTLLKMVLQCL